MEDSGNTRTWREVVFTWLMLALVLTVIATLCTFAAALHPTLELSVHFKVAYWWAGLLCTVGFCVLKRWVWAGLALVLLTIHSVGILPWYIPRDVEVPANLSPNLTILCANVLSTNKSPEKVISYIRDIQPDLVLLQEVSPEWVTLLQPLIDSDYPYSKLEPQSDNFGMATLSRVPVSSMHILAPVSSAIPVIETKLEINGRALSVLNFHPLPPGRPAMADLRNEQLDYLGPYITEQSDLSIVAGDFNVTPWSPNYDSMLEETGLYNTRKGFGMLLTWPKPPIIPIDHILASPAIITLDMQAGPNVGSDHRPLVVELYIPPKAEPSPTPED